MKTIQHSLLITTFLLTTFSINAQNIQNETNREELFSLASTWKAQRKAELEEGKAILKNRGFELRYVGPNGEIIEFQGFDDKGNITYYTTENKDAARTISTSKVWPGGGSGLSLKGDSMTVGEWDGGAVRASHQELVGRVTQVDSATSIGDHPTHVAGTMIASGVDTSAQGMAYNAHLDAYDWNFDDSEMATAAANGLLLSNHSYGSVTGWRYSSASSEWQWWGDTTLSGTEDYRFGLYTSQSASWDLIGRNAPYYLIVKSAGNDRGDQGSGSHYLPLHNTYSSTVRPPDGGTSGYDCISSYSGAKNILTVGAVDAIPNGYSGPSSVVMSSFSGWGPTDDGRIKPDLVTNGVGVYSSTAVSNTSYASWPGTSMATPGATGSLLLLQEVYSDNTNTYMKAATLKALAIHTADEAGSSPGPDYKFGWGLMNTATAALHIIDTTGNKDITEASISNGNTYSFNITANGFSPIKVTICWTDVPGTPTSASLNPTTAMLVNDLDVRVIRNSDSTIYYPYILNPASPASAAATGDNSLDNVEQIYIASPTAGSYTVIVSHKGSLSGGSTQNFSLILDGGDVPAQPLSCSSIISAPAFWNFDTLTNCSSTAGAACQIPTWYGWTNDSTDNIDWTVTNATTPSSGTGPTTDYNTGTTTGKYLYTEASTSGTGFPSKQAVLYSPCISLDTITNAELTFAYHMFGPTTGSLSVEIFNGYVWNSVWSASGQQSTDWLFAYVDLSAYDGDTIKLRFVGTTGSNYQSDMAIDAVGIHEKLPCSESTNPLVSNITDSTCILSWTSTAQYWKIRLDLHDSTTIIPPATINFNPVYFSGLIPGTSYDIYIQDSCGNGDTSAWIGPIIFKTTGGPVNNPSDCGINRYIPDNSCPSLYSLPINVSTFGSQMGIDVYLKEVKVIIEHTYASDLVFGIVSPSNDSILLSSFNGGSGDHYGNPFDTTCSQMTTFSMSASTSISSGTAPFIGSYLPQDSLTLFNSGSNPNGTWQLFACDNFAADSGYIQFVELVFDSITCTNPLVSIANSGNNTVCQGTTLTLSTSGGISYQWYRNGTMISGATNDSLIVLNSGNYNVLVSVPGGCVDSAVSGMNIVVNPLPNVSIGSSGTSYICQGSSVTLSTSGGAGYQWYFNGSMIPGANSSALQASDSGFYNVMVQDSNLCSDSAVSGFLVTINPLPIVTITAIGDTVFCDGDSVILGTTVGLSNYQWMLNGNPIPGGGNPSVLVKNGGYYNVLVTDGNNCSDSASRAKRIIVNQVPFVALVVGDSSLCDGDSTIISAPPGNAYQWLKNGKLIPGATSSDIEVNEAGWYNVVVTNGFFCIDTAMSGIKIRILDLPDVSLGNLDDLCQRDGQRVLQTGLPVGGAYSGLGVSGSSVNGYFFDPSVGAGNYVVVYRYTDSENCSDTASRVQIVKNCVGIDENNSKGEVVFYPNPTQGLLYISLQTENDDPVVVNVYDVNSKLVHSETISLQGEELIELNMSHNVNGVYFVQLQQGPDIWRQKIILDKNL